MWVWASDTQFCLLQGRAVRRMALPSAGQLRFLVAQVTWHVPKRDAVHVQWRWCLVALPCAWRLEKHTRTRSRTRIETVMFRYVLALMFQYVLSVMFHGVGMLARAHDDGMGDEQLPRLLMLMAFGTYEAY